MAAVQIPSSMRPVTPTPTPTQHVLLPQQIYLSPPRMTPSLRPDSDLAILSPVSQNGSFAFHRVIKSGQMDRRVKKKGTFKSSWKTAYLVLRPGLLSVYKDEKESELKLSITLSDVTAVTPVKKSRTDHVVGIFSPSKNYHFASATAQDAADWISALRSEIRPADAFVLHPPSARFGAQDQPNYDTTDMSGDDREAWGSPLSPPGNLSSTRSHAETRSIYNPAIYSGNEQTTTSQSDFSDFGSVPQRSSFLSSSIPITNTPLSPIPDDVATTSIRPPFARGLSNLSDTNIPTSQKSTRPAQQPQLFDPSKVIRQGHLKISKSTSGVRQWRTCWAVLRSYTLSIYKSLSEYSPALILPTYSIVEAAEIERKRENCFQIIGEDKTYRFQAESENELEMWLGALKSVLVKMETGRKSQDASVSLARDQLIGGIAMAISNVSAPIKERPLSRDMTGMTNVMREMSIASTRAPSTRIPSSTLDTSTSLAVTDTKNKS